MNWDSFAPRSWKIGTVKTLFRRAMDVCSTEASLQKEILFLKRVFIKINGYPSRVVNKILRNIQENRRKQTGTTVTPREGGEVEVPTQEDIFHHLCLPYKGKEGENIVNKFKSQINRVLPKNVKPRFIFKGKKLGSYFPIKDKVKAEHLSGLVYGFHENPDSRTASYIGETKVRFGTRINDHLHSDKNSNVFKHIRKDHLEVSNENFRIIESGFQNTVNRKLAEALYIKEHHPPLNEQVKSYKLHLFN